MLGLQYVEKAKNHWEQWLPKMVAEMRAEGTYNQELQKASKEASAQIATLMKAGMQRHEAEEMVLPELILLPPEPGADLPSRWDEDDSE